MERQDFRIDSLLAGDDTLVLRATGEIDLCSSFSFREQMIRAADGAASRLVLDLSSVRFIDSSGLSVMIATAKRLFLQGRELVLVCSENRIRRVLMTSGLDRLVPVHAAMSEALGGLATAQGGPVLPALPQ